MSTVFESRYYGDPAEVAEVNELKALHAEARKRETEREQQALQARRQRIHDQVFKKAGAK